MFTNRLRRIVGAAAAVLCIAAAAGPASAMAEVAFSPSNAGMKWSGTLTLKAESAPEKTCTFPNERIAGIGGTRFSFTAVVKIPCTGGTVLEWWPLGEAVFYEPSGYHIQLQDFQGQQFRQSPYGTYLTGFEEVPWTNGSGTTASTITFKETKMGMGSLGGWFTATGTLKVTTSTGGLLTLTH